MEEDYWDEKSSVDFCIAKRTRDILLSRKIVDDFVQSRRTAQKKVIFNFEQEAVWQEYFSTYVRNEMQIAEFWGIFIEASEKFARRYAELDEIWYAKLLEARANEKNLDDLKEGYGTYLDLFRAYRNTNFGKMKKIGNGFFINT